MKSGVLNTLNTSMRNSHRTRPGNVTAFASAASTLTYPVPSRRLLRYGSPGILRRTLLGGCNLFREPRASEALDMPLTRLGLGMSRSKGAAENRECAFD